MMSRAISSYKAEGRFFKFGYLLNIADLPGLPRQDAVKFRMYSDSVAISAFINFLITAVKKSFRKTTF